MPELCLLTDKTVKYLFFKYLCSQGFLETLFTKMSVSTKFYAKLVLKD